MRVHALPFPRPRSERARPARRGGWIPGVVTDLLALALAVIALAALDPGRPWIKQRLLAFARSSTGLEVDFGSIRLHPLSGVDVGDLVVRSAPGLRPFARDLLHAGRVEVRWSPSSLLGNGPRFETITLSDVALAVVVDEEGRTSFDAIGSPGTRGSPATPLSRRAAQLLAAAPPVVRIDVTRLDVAVIRTRGGRVVERDRVGGLAAGATAEPDRGGWRVHAAAGSAGAPLDLQLTRERDDAPTGGARARLSLAVDVDASTLSVTGDLNVLDQSLFPRVGPGDWHAEASARFDPAASRTTLTLRQVSAAAGAATVDASLEVPDEGDPTVRHAQGEIDGARLLAWLPAGLVPVVAERAQLHFRIDSAVLGRVPRFGEGGGMHLDAELSNAHVRTSAGVIDLDRGQLELEAHPEGGSGVAVRGRQRIDGVRVGLPEGRLELRALEIDLDGERADDGALTGSAGLRFGTLRHEGPVASVVARDGRCEVRVTRLYPSGAEPLRTRGDVSVAAGAASLDARIRATRVSADAIALDARGRLDGDAPYGAELDARSSGLEISSEGRRLVARAPARMRVRFEDVVPDAAHPLASRGAVRASIDFDQGRASLDAVKGAGAIAYTLDARARSLRALRLLLSPPLAGAMNLDTVTLALRSRGRVEPRAGGDLWVQEDTSLDLAGPAFGAISARSLSLEMHSRGTASHQEVVASLTSSALAIDGSTPGNDAATLSATLDRSPPSVHLEASVAGRTTGRLQLSATFDRDARAVVYDVDGRFSRLAPLAPLLARVNGLGGFDLSRLELGLTARGTLLGVVSNVSSGGGIELEPDPLRTAAIAGTSDVRLANLRWARGDTALVAPAAAWHADMRAEGARRTLDVHLSVDSLRLRLGGHEVDVAGASDDATAEVTGDLRDPTIDLTQRAAIRTVQQDVAIEYPVGDVTLTMSARRDREGLVRVSGLKLQNGRGGTTLALDGGLDLAGKRRLSMKAGLSQDLRPLSAFPQRFAGRGKVELAATLESPDLTVFRARVEAKLADVHVRMPGVGFEADAVDGEIPVRVAFDVSHAKDGSRGEVRLSPYARLRFADQHPLLRRSGFLSIGRVTTPRVTIAPFVGNLSVEQNVFSLRQFEMGVGDGWVTGDGVLDWNGADSRLEARVRASGLRSSEGEPFDGNFAVVVAGRDRMIEGRAEILRMGRRHLLDLLDLEDPLRVDVAMNRVRSALGFGYPRRIRIAFDNGFASVRLDLGGLARLWSVGELRGIPTGPIVSRVARAAVGGKGAP